MAIIPDLLKKQNPKEAFLVLDIGTKIIKAVIFFIDDGKVIVSGYGREFQRLVNYAKDVKSLADFCKVAISRAQNQARVKKIDGIILGFGGGAVRGENFSQKFFREDPQKYIDVVELKNILQKLQWKAREEICRNSEESSSCPPKLLQSWICEARVDGYQVTNPFDFQGKEIMLSVFNSYSTGEFLNFLEEFSGLLRMKILGIFDENFSVYQIILRKKGQNLGAILIDIGGFSTQISLIRKGKLEKSINFGIGGQNFTDVLIKTFGVSEMEAEDIKVKYGKGELGYGVAKKIAKIFEPVSSLWYEALNLSFDDVLFKNYLPSQIFLFGGGSLLPEIKEGLAKKKFRDRLSNLPDFEASIFTPNNFKNSLDSSGDFESPQDTIPLALAMSFSSTIEKENVFEKILKQTLRIIQ